MFGQRPIKQLQMTPNRKNIGQFPVTGVPIAKLEPKPMDIGSVTCRGGTCTQAIVVNTQVEPASVKRPMIKR